MNAATAPLSPPAFADCDRELIHLPGSIQPHGLLLIFAPTDVARADAPLIVSHASANAASLLGVGQTSSDLVGRPLGELVSQECANAIHVSLAESALDVEARYVCNVPMPGAGPGEAFNGLMHRLSDGRTVLEFERATSADAARDLYLRVRRSVSALERAGSVLELCRVMSVQTRHISGYDRAQVYQFDDDWNGKTIAEDRAAHMGSYLDLHFPAADIPAQARRLYATNRIRQIPDIYYRPVPLVPSAGAADAGAGRPVDLSYSVLRSVSPVHVEYLRNMRVRASMSVSILRDGKLWGLVACHHAVPIYLPFEVRMAVEHIAQAFAMQLAAREASEAAGARIAYSAIRTSLLAKMAGQLDFVEVMAASEEELFGLTNATGVALLLEDRVRLVGRTPTREQVERLVQWVESAHAGNEPFVTRALGERFPEASGYADRASGLIAVCVSGARRSWILWFRPEVITDVNWAGDPRKVGSNGSSDPAAAAHVPPVDGVPKLHPRNSFEVWRQTVSGHSTPWNRHEIESATEMRDAVVRIVLRRAEELAALSEALQKSNRELEAFSYSVSHDLRAPFRHIVGFSDLLMKRAADLDDTAKRYVATIADSARFAGALVDSLLSYSHLGRVSMKLTTLDMNDLVRSVREQLMSGEPSTRKVEWHVDANLPTVQGDHAMLKLALYNLLANALKYTRTRDVAKIAFTYERVDGEHLFRVGDNGVGFDAKYVGKLFGVFQRLHRVEEFEGTGIGLANVRRTMERHNGRTWAEGETGKGATFFFTLPAEPQ